MKKRDVCEKATLSKSIAKTNVYNMQKSPLFEVKHRQFPTKSVVHYAAYTVKAAEIYLTTAKLDERFNNCWCQSTEATKVLSLQLVLDLHPTRQWDTDLF